MSHLIVLTRSNESTEGQQDYQDDVSIPRRMDEHQSGNLDFILVFNAA